MPVHNCAEYVVQAVRSILDQDFRDFEFLIYDDGSSDSSVELLQKLALNEPRIRLNCCSHRGYTACLNDGLHAAQGEYLARMDSDDIALPSRFSLQVAYLDENQHCVAVGGQVLQIDSDGDSIAPFTRAQSHDEIDSRHLSTHGGHIVHPTAMMRKAAVLAIGGYRPELEPAEDLDLWLRLAEVGRLANLPQTLLLYRCHLKSVSHTRLSTQMQRSSHAVAEARIRRGLPAENRISVVVETIPTSKEIGWMWVRQAIRHGYYRTARKHSRRLILRDAMNPLGWKLFIGAQLGTAGRLLHNLMRPQTKSQISNAAD